MLLSNHNLVDVVVLCVLCEQCCGCGCSVADCVINVVDEVVCWLTIIKIVDVAVLWLTCKLYLWMRMFLA